MPLPISIRAVLLSLFCAWTMSACASATPSSVPAKEAAAVTTPESNPSNDSPTLTAEEIGKRFLQLLEGLESREHLSRERVETALGVPLRRFDGTPDYLFAYSQPLKDGWYFSVNFISGSASLQRGVSLAFGKPGGANGPIPADVCALDFDYYHNALQAMGFVAQQHHGEHNLFLGWRYTKFKKSDGTVDMTISIVQMAGNEPGHLCVKSIGTLN
jgi:hypothetical protein